MISARGSVATSLLILGHALLVTESCFVYAQEAGSLLVSSWRVRTRLRGRNLRRPALRRHFDDSPSFDSHASRKSHVQDGGGRLSP